MNGKVKKLAAEIITAHKKLLAEFETRGIETIAASAKAITEALRKGRTLYICGNGGSAADAQHIAAELVGRFERQRKALAAIALTTDTSILTAVSNDYGYEKVFARQVAAMVKKGDMLWAFSTSGSSLNIIAAIEQAREKGASVLAFTGKSNSKIERLADICFCANSTSTARSQEIHQLAYHIICDLVERNFNK